MTIRAADDFETIRSRVAEIAKEEVPLCPSRTEVLLRECLRSPQPCVATCPHANDWIGLQADA